MHNIFFLSLFNVADKSWFCTSHNQWLEFAQTDCFFVCNIGFGLDAIICIVAYLVIIKINDEAQVFIDLTGINGVNIGSWNVKVLTLRLVFLILLFFLFPRSYKKLWIVRMQQNCWLWAPVLRFFYLWIFCCLSFSRKGVYWLIASVALLVKVLVSKDLYFSFRFSLDSFFDQVVPTV